MSYLSAYFFNSTITLSRCWLEPMVVSSDTLVAGGIIAADQIVAMTLQHLQILRLQTQMALLSQLILLLLIMLLMEQRLLVILQLQAV